ncbi:MAG: Ig-like domain-containing protein, partial [Aureliella sp.]
MKSRKAQKRSSLTSRQAVMRKLLGRVRYGAMEQLESRQLMTAQPWSDGFYYPKDAVYTAWLPKTISYQEFANRAAATSGEGNGTGAISAEGAGTTSAVTEVEPNNRLQDAQFLNLGTAPGKDSAINVIGALPVNPAPFGRQDEDYFAFDLRAGDVLDAQIITGSATRFDVSIMDATGAEVIANNQSIPQGIYPPSSPLMSVGNLGNPLATTNLAFTVPKTGRYYARVSDGDSTYTLTLRTYRSPLESTPVNTKQKIFVDFNGAIVRGESYGSVGTKRLSPLSSFLPGWNLTPADENQMIDKILISLKKRFTGLSSLINGGNGYFAQSGIGGQYDVEILNSRDNPDSFGDPNVSRLIIGGTSLELGINTIGIAEAIDVGNFSTTDSAVILLDNITTPAGFGTVPYGPKVTQADFIAEAIGRVAAHEAGHFLGAWHTVPTNNKPQIMDTGGVPANLMGVGPDGIYGTDDDVDVEFGTDTYDPTIAGSFIMIGEQNSAATLAFGMATGTIGGNVSGTVYQDTNVNRVRDGGEPGLGGWRVYADLNNDGVLQSSEPIATTSSDGTFRMSLNPGNYTIREEVQPGFNQSAPVSKSYSVSVVVGSSIGGLNFGNERIDQTITGFKWNDLNGNGLVDAGEPRMQGVWIYIDLDRDERIDLGEPSTTTDSNGRYTLRFPGPGTYAVREALAPGYVQTYPGPLKNNQHIVTVTGNSAVDAATLAGLNFGNRFYVDMGDAPNSYGTLLSSNGAAHGQVPGLYLGQNWDAESDGQPSADALGDDRNGPLDFNGNVTDDEDAITLARPISRTATNVFNVTATNITSAPAYIQAWIDLNGDGDFTDSGEKIVTNAVVPSGFNGTTTVTFPALGGAKLGDTYARVRLSYTRDLGPTGIAESGEVEDYKFTIVDTPNIANNDTFQVSRNSSLNSLDVTANDFKLPGEQLTIVSASASSAGAILQITSDNKILYTPPSGFVGKDTFTYTVQTSTGETSTASVLVDVNLFFQNPMAIDDSFDVPTNAISYPLNVLANDIEGQAGALSIISVTQPNLGGQITIATGGQSLRYTPARDVGGTEQFTYTVSDASGKTSTATVTLHTQPGDQTDDEVLIRLVATDLNGNPITAVPQGQDFRVDVYVDDLRNDKNPPIFVDAPGVYAAYLDLLYNLQLVSTTPSQPGNRFDFDVQFFNNYTNFQLGDASVPGIIDDFGAFNNSSAMSQPDPVRMASIRFTARAPGIATFKADPADSPPETDTILFNVPGSPVPTAKIRYVGTTLEIVGDSVEFPQAVDDSFSTNIPAGAINYPLNVLPNDRPGSTNVIHLQDVTQPANGSVTISNNGTPNTPGDDRILYTPNVGFVGTDSFKYTIQDARGVQSTATVTVRVGSTQETNANDDVNLRLQIYKADGTPLADGENLVVGQQFQLRGFVQDLRNPFGNNRGVFAAFEDVLYNASTVSPVAN